MVPSLPEKSPDADHIADHIDVLKDNLNAKPVDASATAGDAAGEPLAAHEGIPSKDPFGLHTEKGAAPRGAHDVMHVGLHAAAGAPHDDPNDQNDDPHAPREDKCN